MKCIGLRAWERDGCLNWKASYGLAALSGILLLLSVPPFRFGGFLAWVAFVPILIALFYETRVKRMERLAKIAGLGSLPLFLWFAWWIPDLLSLAHLEHLFWLWFVIGLALAILFAIGFYGDDALKYWKAKHLPSKSLPYLPSSLQLFVIPLAVAGIEFLAMNIPGVMRIGGFFGFFSVAKTQWLNPPIMHLASFTGMYGVTFLVLLVNCAIAYGIIHYRETRRIFKPAIAAFCLFVLAFSYGWVSIPSEKEGDTVVTVIQVPPMEGEDTDALYMGLSDEALKYDPQIIIWPWLSLEGLSINPHENFSREHNVCLAGGAEGSSGPGFGCGVLSPSGKMSIDYLGYHMATIPYYATKDIKGFFFPEVHSLNTGLGKIGIVDCMESASTLPTRDRVKDGAQFLIVPTGTPNSHVFSWALGTNAIYRAVEHRTFAVEVIGDHDASMLIDPYGRIIDDIAPEPEIVAGKISFTGDRTFYSRHGDVFGWTIVGLFLALIGYNLYLKRKTPYVFCKKCRAQIEKGTKVCPECGKKQ